MKKITLIILITLLTGNVYAQILNFRCVSDDIQFNKHYDRYQKSLVEFKVEPNKEIANQKSLILVKKGGEFIEYDKYVSEEVVKATWMPDELIFSSTSGGVMFYYKIDRNDLTFSTNNLTSDTIKKATGKGKCKVLKTKGKRQF